MANNSKMLSNMLSSLGESSDPITIYNVDTETLKNVFAYFQLEGVSDKAVCKEPWQCDNESWLNKCSDCKDQCARWKFLNSMQPKNLFNILNVSRMTTS